MKEKADEDIMADYLLKGGKMLSDSCTVCGAPLFDYNGEIFCVVCQEKGVDQGTQQPPDPEKGTRTINQEEKPNIERFAPAPDSLLAECDVALSSLFERICDERLRPDELLVLSEAVLNCITARDILK